MPRVAKKTTIPTIVVPDAAPVVAPVVAPVAAPAAPAAPVAEKPKAVKAPKTAAEKPIDKPAAEKHAEPEAPKAPRKPRAPKIEPPVVVPDAPKIEPEPEAPKARGRPRKQPVGVADEAEPMKRKKREPKLDADGNVIKRAPTAYIIFLGQAMLALKEEYKDYEVKPSQKELMAEAAAKWREHKAANAA